MSRPLAVTVIASHQNRLKCCARYHEIAACNMMYSIVTYLCWCWKLLLARYMGTITGISDLDPVRWPNSHWRSVKVFGLNVYALSEQPQACLCHCLLVSSYQNGTSPDFVLKELNVPLVLLGFLFKCSSCAEPFIVGFEIFLYFSAYIALCHKFWIV